jgi:ribokinase
MTKIIVVGDICTEVSVTTAGSFAPPAGRPASIITAGGGTGANTAAWLAAAGIDVTLCGVVGDDDPGDIRIAELEIREVTCAIRREPDASTGTVVLLTMAGEHTVLTDRGANSRLTLGDVDAALAGAPDSVHVHVCGSSLLDPDARPAALHALAAAAELGLTTSVDAASAATSGEDLLSWVRATDALLATVHEAQALLATDESDPAVLVRALARRCGSAIVRLTGGGAVSYVLGSNGVVSVPGAGPASSSGDAFTAGYLAAWLAGASSHDALAVAAEMGSSALAE